MGKKSTKTPRASALPKAPIVYLNDPVKDMPHARYVRDMIPEAILAFGPREDKKPHNNPPVTLGMIQRHIGIRLNDRILVVGDNQPDTRTKVKIETAKEFQDHAIKHGCNFASVNLYTEQGAPAGDKKKKWSTNHLDLCIKDLSVEDVAEKVYHWLFTVFTVQETLHLIPESEMLITDGDAFPEYEYCPINESKLRPKNAKIQFVALANFYFQYRGASSQYTWDWVQNLKVGERRALPRMPMVEIKERKVVRAAKAPIRTVGFALAGVGSAIRGVGHSVKKMGEMGRLGKSAEWVPEADVLDGKKVGWEQKEKVRAERVKMERAEKQVQHKVFNEKGEKLWKDDDSVASTAKGDEVVMEKEFC
ncbi:hypothetical protein LTS15_006780 [Exophiala xenobiotica]|nr:hypothetical protein LTS15_006780 [Exophiala xenobiotica]